MFFVNIICFYIDTVLSPILIFTSLSIFDIYTQR